MKQITPELLESLGVPLVKLNADFNLDVERNSDALEPMEIALHTSEGSEEAQALMVAQTQTNKQLLCLFESESLFKDELIARLWINWLKAFGLEEDACYCIFSDALQTEEACLDALDRLMLYDFQRVVSFSDSALVLDYLSEGFVVEKFPSFEEMIESASLKKLTYLKMLSASV